LGHHIYEPKIYLIIFQTVFGYYRSLTPQVLEDIDLLGQFDLDNLIKILFSRKNLKNFKQEEIICKDLILSTTSMIHSIFCSMDKSNPRYGNYPQVLVLFLRYLYNNNRDMRLFCQTNFEFLSAICRSIVYDLSSKESELVEHPSIKLI